MISIVPKLLALLTPGEKLRLAGLGVLMLMTMGLEIAGIGLILPLLNIVADPAAIENNEDVRRLYTASGADGIPTFVVRMSAAVFLFFIFKNVSLALIYFSQNVFLQRKVARFCTDLLDGYFQQPYIFHRRMNSSEIIRNIQMSTPRVFTKGLLSGLQLTMETLLVIGIVGLVVVVEPLSTLIIAGFLGAVLVAYYAIVRKKLYRWGRGIQTLDQASLQALSQGLGGIKEHKLSGRTAFFTETFARSAHDKADILSLTFTMPQIPRLIIETAAIGAILLVLSVSISVEQNMAQTLPKIGLFAIAAMRLMPSLNRIMSNITVLREATSEIETIHRRFTDGHEIENIKTSAPPIVLHEAVALRGIGFSFPGSDIRVVDGVDLTLKAGEFVAFVGASGAGKTTLIDIMLGLIEPTEGTVAVDGRDIRENLPSWQQAIGYIPQDSYILDDTVRRNVAFGLHDDAIDDTKVMRALELARLADFVAALPDRLGTVLAEKGARLSGGQRQRIAIARALYNDPDILVMDEATSALDNATEREIAMTISALKGKKTVVVIAHRLSTVKICDQIVYMENGRVAAAGSFDDLRAHNESFAKLVELGQLT